MTPGGTQPRSAAAPAVNRGFAVTPAGQIHYAVAGRGEPVVLLHQTPRSWDEFRDVLPLIGRQYRVFGIDTIGFGDSYRPAEACSIESCALGVIDFLDTMGLQQVSLVGHHTGGVIAARPERVQRLVLSSTPYIDADERERRRQHPLSVDQVEAKDDGSHLTQMWQRRQAFYPEGRPDLLARFVIDAMKVGSRVEEGHEAVGRYVMEQRLPRIVAPTLIMCGGADRFALPSVEPLAAAIPGSRTVILPEGMVPMPDQMPHEFAQVVLDFLDETPTQTSSG